MFIVHLTYTADFIKKVLGVYTRSMIYLSLRSQVAVGTFCMKSPVSKYLHPEKISLLISLQAEKKGGGGG